MTSEDLNTELMDSAAPVELLRLDEFSPALAASPDEAAEVRRRFETLLLPLAATGAKRHTSSANHVYKALNTQGQELAVKVLTPVCAEKDGDVTEEQAQEQNRTRMAAFLEEYRSLVTLTNLKGFPRVYGMGTVGEASLIVMEWVEGITLAELMTQLPASTRADADGTRRHCIRPDVVADIMLSVLSVLEGTRALDRTFTHRDLSPRNILVRTSRLGLKQQLESGAYDVMLVDLGSSLVQQEDEPTFTMRQRAWRFGTAEYAAPEMLTRDIEHVEELRRSETVDTYALCSIAYQMLTGCTPFGLSKHAVISPYLAKMDEKPKELPCGERGSELLRITLRGMRAAQSERYSLSGLDTAVREWKTADSKGTAGAPGKTLGRLALLATGAAVAVGGAAASLLRRRRS